MMRRSLALLLWCCTIAIPVCSIAYAQSPVALWAGLRSSLRTGQIDANTVVSLLVYIAVVLWTVLIVVVVRTAVSAHRGKGEIASPRITGVLASALLLLLSQRGTAATTSSEARHDRSESVPVVAAAAPIIAAALLGDVLARRRGDLIRINTTQATAGSFTSIGIEPDVASSPELQSQPSVDSPAIDSAAITDDIVAEHRVVVRVFGYPVVENVAGTVAVFRKNRAHELVVWLVLNRDRMRRSAARTAMWEGTVSDSSFATIVSDARRALSELCVGTDPRAWMPPTFTDELPMSTLVVSDVDLLQSALAKFRSEPQRYAELVMHHLDDVRDLPFAGTNFRWPDLDGTTTRLVMLVLTAVSEVVEHALGTGDTASAMRALGAGLRMMPGDATLLDLQRKLCASEPVRTRRLFSQRMSTEMHGVAG